MKTLFNFVSSTRTQIRNPKPAPLDGCAGAVVDRLEARRISPSDPGLRNSFGFRIPVFGFFLLFTLAGFLPHARAVIPAPDNIFYGTITIDGALITAASNQVSVEARGWSNGPALATYRMGSDVRATNYYVLRPPLEELPELKGTNASLVGGTIYLVVKVGALDSPIIAITNLTRGVATRINLGLAPANDSDSLPDDWELAYFSDTSRSPNDLAPNGRTLQQNFTEGADPNSTNGLFRLTVTLSNAVTEVTFFARRAEGAGYAGYTRRYTLETRSTFNGGAWQPVPELTNIVGTNQTVRYVPIGTNTFFRGLVYLGAP